MSYNLLTTWKMSLVVVTVGIIIGSPFFNLCYVALDACVVVVFYMLSGEPSPFHFHRPHGCLLMKFIKRMLLTFLLVMD